MTSHLQRALGLWARPVPEDDTVALAAFREVYADPLTVNGASTPLQVLVDRARMLQVAFADLGHDVQDHFGTDDRNAFAFRLSGRHVGPLTTPLGTVAATGRDLSVMAMDIFEIADDRVAAVWAVADWLDLLTQVGVVSLTAP